MAAPLGVSSLDRLEVRASGEDERANEPLAEGGLGIGVEALRHALSPTGRRGEPLGVELREVAGDEYLDGFGDDAREGEGEERRKRREVGVDPAKKRGVKARGNISRSARVFDVLAPMVTCSTSSLNCIRSSCIILVSSFATTGRVEAVFLFSLFSTIHLAVRSCS